VKAAESYLKSGTPLPVNLKLLIEGEEEVGSKHLAAYVEQHKKDLACDVIVISDTAMFGPGVPSVTVGLRGLAYVQVTLDGPDRDLHSGVYGGGVENPVNALARLIAGLHDDQHRVNLPGFYDNVRPLAEEERQAWRDLPFDEARWLGEIGLTTGKTEAGYSIFEGTTARPTLDVNGIGGGYQGAGSKTVLPARAFAKISCRLVPDQDPHEVADMLRAYFEAHTPPTMKLTFEEMHGGMPVLMDVHQPAMQAAKTALQETYNREPYFTREGGSIPVVADLKRILGVDCALLGFGLTGDSIHSPDEHFGLDRYHAGIETVIRFWQHFGAAV
ncbi:MAG TPA: M20/M25/M40 family metallo-hydrolase, partial [Rhodothermales bacterium]|nr:M20/M25/M40 family metallo-hydrolase [Rhodothermales bacterium]